MTILEKRIININLEKDNIPNIDELFGNQACVDMKNIPEKQRPLIAKTRDTAFKNFKLVVKYDYFEIDKLKKEAVCLKNGESFEGTTLPKVFEKSQGVIGIIITLKGFEEIEGSVVEKYFLDSWATAMVSATGRKVIKDLKEKLLKKGLYSTLAWSPGQHNVPIENQKHLFGVLKPEEIGVVLNKSMLMHPQKSETLIFGVNLEMPDNTKGPCEYCEKKETCPSSTIISNI